MRDILEEMVADEPRNQDKGFAIACGQVINNIDLIGEGRVMVNIASRPSLQVWARIVAVGGASGRGFAWVPALGDEVLVAFSEDDLTSAYILGGLWSTLNRPPFTLPSDVLQKRIIQTGLTSTLGHTVEFDDVEQSVTITTSSGQSITMDPLKIQLTNIASSVTITLDNDAQKVTIEALDSIELTAVNEISLQASQINLEGDEITITSSGPCSVTGLPIKLN